MEQISTVQVNFISKKKDKFNSEVCYFKLISDFTPEIKYKEDEKLPFWKPDENTTLLKIKPKNINKDIELNEGFLYDLKLLFSFYRIGNNSGYYCKILKATEI